VTLNLLSASFATSSSWDGGTITISPNTTLAANKNINNETLLMWHPTGNGAGTFTVINVNLSVTGGSDPIAIKDCVDNTAGHFTNVNRMSTYSLPIDPNVRSSYPDDCVRDIDAKCVLSVNMGGGYASLKAKRMLHHHFDMTPMAIVQELKSDLHDTKTLRVGYDNKKGARFEFHPWTQSPKALGEWTSAKANPRLLDDAGAETITAPRPGYNDSFPFGGYFFCFSELAPLLNTGAAASISVYVRQDIQVQLSSSMNHLRMTAHNLTHPQFEKHHLKDKQPRTTSATGDAVGALFNSELKGGKKGGTRGMKPNKNGKPNSRRTQPADENKQKAKSQGSSVKEIATTVAARKALEAVIGHGGRITVDAIARAAGAIQQRRGRYAYRSTGGTGGTR